MIAGKFEKRKRVRIFNDRSRLQNAGGYYGGSGAEAQTVAHSIHATVDSRIREVLYPEHEWNRIWINGDQINTDISENSRFYDYTIRDTNGVAAFIGNGVNANIPEVGISMRAVTLPLALSAVSAKVTNEDAREYAGGFNRSLPNDLADVMSKAMDNLIERSVIFGFEPLNFQPAINYPTAGIYNAPVVGASSTWASKTAEQILADINSFISTAIEATNGLFQYSEMILPRVQFGIISTRPMVLGTTTLAETILSYVKRNNQLTAELGMEIDIHSSRYLYNAGGGGRSRGVLIDRNSKHQTFPFPMPYRLSPPVPIPLGSIFVAEQKFGTYHVEQPGSVFYIDGI